MAIFILVFLGIYGSLHAYTYFKIALPLALHGWRALALAAFLLLMMLGPVLVRILEQRQLHVPARALAFLTYIWMAVLLWFFFLALARDLWNLAVRLAALAAPVASSLIVPARPYLLLCAALILLAGTRGIFEARDIRIERLAVETSLLPSGSGPVKVAQISDVHFGLLEGKGRLSRILAILESEKPDILVSTGDLVDGMALHLNHLAEDLARVGAPLGKFAVTGNHEYYAGLAESLNFMRESGFTVLRGESALAGGIRIAGVDDRGGHHAGAETRTDENGILPGRSPREFTILLKHQPQVNKDSLGRFDMQLSGHTHGGQLWPFGYLVRLRYPSLSGLADLGGGSSLYTNRGTGTWGPPLRLFSPPEVTMITITPEGNKENQT